MSSVKIKSGLLMVAVLLTFFVSAQHFDNMAAALKTGNASALAQYFGGNVDIVIKDNEASYSKAQAEMVLKNFFSNNQPRGFSINHEGTSPEGSKYFIGNLVTSGGTYRTYVYAKPSGATLVIQQLRFEKQ